ncbi:MAG: hypothetical protein JO001_16260 [Alphaproteobacteria bacterium]|nr:hypothetical protein [Alphaproteobacteria bacterium]
MMLRLLVCIVLVSFASIASSRAEDSAAGCQITGTNIGSTDKGYVEMTCGGITQDTGNQLNDIINRIVQNRLDPQVISARLDDIVAMPPDDKPRAVSDDQRQKIIKSLVGIPPQEVGITAHPLADDSVDYARTIAAALLQVGWKIDGQEIQRIAPRVLNPVLGTAIVVRDRDNPPAKARQLKAALLMASVAAPLVSDPSMSPDTAIVWVGRRPGMPGLAK